MDVHAAAHPQRTDASNPALTIPNWVTLHQKTTCGLWCKVTVCERARVGRPDFALRINGLHMELFTGWNSAYDQRK